MINKRNEVQLKWYRPDREKPSTKVEGFLRLESNSASPPAIDMEVPTLRLDIYSTLFYGSLQV